MLSGWTERKLLQTVIAVAGIVPVGAGVSGVLLGPNMFGPTSYLAPDTESHFRYMSGLLLAIGISFYASIPAIERHTGRIRLLAFIVFCGGLARLTTFTDAPNYGSIGFALAMELVVTPALAVWQARVARLYDPAGRPCD
jgi:hypothetical protein